MRKLILVLLFTPAFFQTFSYAGQMPLKIMSFNLHCLEDNWVKRLEIFAQEAARISPDIISLQEVCTTETENGIQFLKEKLMMAGYPLQELRVQYTHKSWDKYYEHLVILTKNKIEYSKQGYLPPSPFLRGYVALKIKGKWFLNTHLEFLDGNYRTEEVKFLMNIFPSEQHVIMGDFNSSPTEEDLVLFHHAGYRSYFPGPTFPAHAPQTTIDGFWLSSNFAYSRADVIRFFQNEYAGTYLSDHFAVLISIY